ncbi:SDR family NAD(P)-dependent oxidoreductase [Xylophilus sp.]|uniref:SDR family NAD(P)-dependent oxidoreductase n=1 Tax=Xylophilus sp. TaxID=2653893 RepID=UPI0013B6A7F8|nr:glucose 1-dehydrogenase [Xylophilus sp.]KAF1044223.1 MAG: 3-oxoacyl-[acyl-carrier-protein] reductase FabG [Xylophilus sp.]
MPDFSNQIVLVTGASGGIGSQIAREFARRGASVVLHDFGLPDAARTLQQKLEAAQARTLLVEGDLTDPAAAARIAQRVGEEFGRLDVLVNNAGASPGKMPFGELPPQTWDQILAINVRSVFLVTQACLPLLEKSSRGRVVNVSSTAARNGGAPGGSAYAAAKGAVSSLTKALAKDFAAKGIHVNAVAPGLVDTPFYGSVNVAEKYAERIKGIPAGRVAVPLDIAGPVLFLASPLADYIVGEVLEVSGGLSLMA